MPRRGTNVKEIFDPNLSDSDDENFELRTSPKKARSQKSNKRSRSIKKTPSQKKRRRRSSDSDIIEEDSDDESVDVSDEVPMSSEPEMDQDTGRPKRKAKAQKKNYVESDEESTDQVEEPQPKKRKLESSPSKPRSLMVKLPVTEEQAAAHAHKNSKKASGAARRRGPAIGMKRNTRANTVEHEELGLDGKPTRTSATPEPQAKATRPSRAAKSVKQPSPIPEATQESSLPENKDETKNARSIRDSHDEVEDEEEAHCKDAKTNATTEDAQANPDEDDEDEDPVTSRPARRVIQVESDDDPATSTRKKSRDKGKTEQGSDFEPEHESGDDDDLSVSEPKDSDSGSGAPVRSIPFRRMVRSKSHSEQGASPEKEAAEELQDLGRRRRPKKTILYEENSRTRRNRQRVNYHVPFLPGLEEGDEEGPNEDHASPSRPARGRGGTGYRSGIQLLSTYGPFGGGGVQKPLIPGQWGEGDAESDDDEGAQAAFNAESSLSMNDTTSRKVTQIGQVQSAKALADIDPLGVDRNIDFSKVGGLEGHIDRLKEMVQMPLLYPELFMKFGVTPPRGVLFHGPPGTGKTLLARALAANVGDGQKKISFYMRKGADTLSKWVGEAERQLGRLFEQARKTQPSIIFFDEIDGLAPVRSSKQDQTHSSIVATLLALMDGMDGRGQVIVIGATNRPDSVDPALRRPGRFDREFYFPLPDTRGRRSIIDIHTSGWGVDDAFKDSLANLTKGYGGADLRAMCTEATLNAIQRTYPQIYSSDQKLLVDADKIKVNAKDFMLSVKKMIPSSQRAASSGAAPLPTAVEPLLRDQFQSIKNLLANLIPMKEKVTALQEAMFEQYEDSDHGFRRELLQQEFETAQVFRPRLLIKGREGMGQTYLGGAILHHFDGLHVQNFDLSAIYGDATKSPEAAIVQFFTEAKRHKPSVIYLPAVDSWYRTLGVSVITTFLAMLNSIPATDQILVLGISDHDDVDEDLKKVFSFSQKNIFTIKKPNDTTRREFFFKIIEYLYLEPKDFPNPANRKPRDLEKLGVAPPPPPREPTKAERKEQKKQDRAMLNTLKVRLQPIMDELKKKYKKFFNPAVSLSLIGYLLDESDPNTINTDISQADRPYELAEDDKGNKGLREIATGKFFYNLDLMTIEERLANGFYARAIDFLTDIRHLVHDHVQSIDRNVKIKAQQLLANVEVDVEGLERHNQLEDTESVYQRQLQRAREKEEKRSKKHTNASSVIAASTQISSSVQAPASSSTPSVSTQAFVERSHQIMGPPRQWGGIPHVQQNNISNTADGARTVVNQTQTFQTMMTGQSPTQFVNDASSTTSPLRTSDSQWSKHGNHDFSTYSDSPRPTSRGTNLEGNSQDLDGDLPATQPQSFFENNTQNSINGYAVSQRGGGHLAQTFYSSHTDVLINSPPSPSATDVQRPLTSSGSSAPQSQPLIPVETEAAQQFLDTLVEGTRGCTVEMLEQVYRELMVLIWRERGNAQRVQVSAMLMSCFDDVIRDMEEVRGLEKGVLREDL